MLEGRELMEETVGGLELKWYHSRNIIILPLDQWLKYLFDANIAASGSTPTKLKNIATFTRTPPHSGPTDKTTA